MLEKPLFALVVTQFKAGFLAQGLAEVQVLQSGQPTLQGRATTPTLYLTTVGPATKRGWPEKTWVPDPEDVNKIVASSRQPYETTFQAMGAFPQDTSATGLTAADIALTARGFLQADFMLEAFLAAGVGLLQPSELRSLKIVNEQDQFENLPSFDFVLTHDQVTLSKTPAAVSTDQRQYPV